MIDKNAIINAAQKYASKGNIDKAIAEWEKLLQNGKDGNIQNTIGDLYLKKGSQEQAVEAFTKAAEIFKKTGFYPKAIAIYKKILNILPNSIEAIIALAKLNATRGFNANAADYYFQAADIFQRNGYAEKATQAVEKILKLSTNDLGTKVKIADWFIKAGLEPRAANEYAAIASKYLRQDDTENAKKYFSKATELDPDNTSSHVGLGKLTEKTGDTELAFKHLEEAMTRDPKSKDTLLAYSELAIRHNRSDDAKKTLLRLIEAAPSYNHPRKLLGKLYLDEKEPEKAWEQLLPCIDDAIKDKKWASAIEMLDNFKELHPFPVRERIVEIYRSSEEKENLAKEIMELAALYEGQGSNDDALRLYRELLESDPDNTGIVERLNALEPAAEPATEAVPEPAAEAAPGSVMENRKEQPPIDLATAEDHVVEKIIPGEPEKDDAASVDPIAEKRREAEFYAKQGMNMEAAIIYEGLLKSSPDNEDIKKRLKELRSAEGPAEEVVVKKMYDGDAETKDDLDAGSTTEDLQEIFNTFSKDEDHEARYKAGLECKQKGRLDEAIKEFGIAAEDPGKKLVSKSMIALCYMEKGAYADAVTEFKHVLEAMSPEDASYLRIKYELAGAYKKNGNETRALELYSEIKEKDPEFKEVSKKMENLKPAKPKSAAPEPKPDEKKPKKKKSRISYI